MLLLRILIYRLGEIILKRKPLANFWAGMAPRVRDCGGGGGVKANLTNSRRRSMLMFDQLESVNVEV